MDEQEQNDILKKFKIKMRLGLSLIVIAGLFISIYFIFFNPIEKNDDAVNTNTNTNTIIIPIEDCTVYFDGCNNCVKNLDGVVGCTAMYCEPEEYEPYKCLDDVNVETHTNSQLNINDENNTNSELNSNQNLNTQSFLIQNINSENQSGWMIHQNQEYGLSFEYPEDWLVNAKKSLSGILHEKINIYKVDEENATPVQEKYKIKISVHKYEKNDKEFNQIVDSLREDFIEYNPVVSNKYQINGLDVVRYEFTGPTSEVITVLYDYSPTHYVYLIGYYWEKNNNELIENITKVQNSLKKFK